MTYLNEIGIHASDSGSLDAFGRWRVSEPYTLFDSKQLHDNAPLFWDEELESGSGITSAHSHDTASSVLTSTLNTAGTFTRQTFMRFNYQPGKSQLILMTGILDRSGGGTGVKRRIGYFDDDNGIFFEDNAGTIRVVRRTSVTGSPVDVPIVQSSWSIDSMDGTGPSGITIDWTKTQIFVIDFEWLGVGRVRLGLNVDGVTHLVHEFLNSNNLDKVYMSTPNLPLRYQMITTASSPASTMEAICGSVIAEGGAQETGDLHYASTESTFIEANTTGTIYAIYGMRLKTTHIDSTVKLVSQTLANATADDFEWLVILNPTVATPITFTDVTNSALQTGPGNAGSPSTSTVTGGTIMAGGYVKSGGNSGDVTIGVNNAILLGSAIDGTRDEIYLCVRPLSSGADIYGGLTWRERL